MDVETLVGTLRTSLGAARLINNKFGSFMDAARRVETLDLDACIFIVAAGLKKPPRDVEDEVYKVGVYDLIVPLSSFLVFLSNGGRPLNPAKDDDTTGEG